MDTILTVLLVTASMCFVTWLKSPRRTMRARRLIKRIPALIQ